MNSESRVQKVRLLMLDCDGVLTDGRIYYGDHGDEIKAFHIQDGMGFTLLRMAGIPSIVVSGKKSRVNDRRARELKIDRLYQGVPDKSVIFNRALKEFRLDPAEVAFVGDDWVDLPVMRQAGWAVAVANAVPEVLEAAHDVTHRRGGEGAVREVIDHLLRCQGRLAELLAKF